MVPRPEQVVVKDEPSESNELLSTEASCKELYGPYPSVCNTSRVFVPEELLRVPKCLLCVIVSFSLLLLFPVTLFFLTLSPLAGPPHSLFNDPQRRP